MTDLTAAEQGILENIRKDHPALSACLTDLLEVRAALVRCYDRGGKLLVCGNGGSCADAMHIAGELCKSFERKRPLPPEVTEALAELPCGEELAQHLEAGLPAIALGLNASLKTAVENDSDMRDIAFAQEVCALTKPEDVVIGISTSGNATNCFLALATAKAIGATAVALTGPDGGRLAGLADIKVRAPGNRTHKVQENHAILYHALCLLVEAHYFPEPR